jgi:hypothetical protein
MITDVRQRDHTDKDLIVMLEQMLGMLGEPRWEATTEGI